MICVTLSVYLDHDFLEGAVTESSSEKKSLATQQDVSLDTAYCDGVEKFVYCLHAILFRKIRLSSF